jgi:hypothetical protein
MSANLVLPGSPEVELPRLFAVEHPNLQLAWDSTSMGWLQECPRKYQLHMLQRWTSKHMAPPLEFGILFHGAMVVYHKARAEKADYDEALHQALQFCLRDGHSLDSSTDNRRTRFTLTRAVTWYLDQFKDDHVETVILDNGLPAVELSFRVELPRISPEGDPYLWCGHIDRLGTIGGDYVVTDYKTTSGALDDKWMAQFSPNIQVSGYLFACNMLLKSLPMDQMLIDGVELKVNFNRFFRAFAKRDEDQLDEFVRNTCAHIRLAEMYAAENYWPMNEKSCGNYGGCVFRGVCGKSPSVRDIWLQGDFQAKEWNPLISREA